MYQIFASTSNLYQKLLSKVGIRTCFPKKPTGFAVHKYQFSLAVLYGLGLNSIKSAASVTFVLPTAANRSCCDLRTAR